MFHANDGLFFERQPDGSVAVMRRVPVQDIAGAGTGGFALVERTVVDPGTWASAVASVSAAGENAERFDAARRFHG